MSLYDYDEEQQYYEQSLADEVVLEFKEKMQDVLLESVKQDIAAIKDENKSLKIKNQELQQECLKAQQLKSAIECQKANLLSAVRRERLGELLKDFQVVMYKPYNEGAFTPKCNKCDDDRKLAYLTPLGKKQYETCDCKKSVEYYVPQEYVLTEFKMDNYYEKKKPLLMWFKIKRSEREDYDYCSYDSSTHCETVYEKGMDFEKIKTYDTFFKDVADCQKYCDWLNNHDL